MINVGENLIKIYDKSESDKKNRIYYKNIVNFNINFINYYFILVGQENLLIGAPSNTTDKPVSVTEN